MEKILNKREEKFSSERMYAHQLITITDSREFKYELIEELVTALKSQNSPRQKKWVN